MVILGLVVGMAVLLVAIARRPDNVTTTGGSGLRVVTTTPVLYSLTVQVLGSIDGLTNLVPPGASPENYALTPRDARAVAQADVLVMNGLNFERFLEQVVGGVRERGAAVVVASTGVPTSPAVEHEAGEEARNGSVDPHVWLDPVRAEQMVLTIADGLARADAAHAAQYRARAASAAKRLQALDTEIRTQFQDVRDRRFIAFHPAWGYFAQRYDLQQIAVVERIPGVEPTAREIAALRERVRATGVRALISEPQFSSRIVSALARDLALRVVEANPEGGELTHDGYERLMRENAAVFASALSAR